MRSGIGGVISSLGSDQDKKFHWILIQLSQLIILRWDQAYGGSDQAWGQIKMKIYQILIQLSELIILRWDQSFGGTDQALGQINMWILYNFHPNIPNPKPGCHRCLTSSWAYVPGKPMYTCTKEFRPQSFSNCYQKTFGDGTHSTLSPALHFQGPGTPR